MNSNITHSILIERLCYDSEHREQGQAAAWAITYLGKVSQLFKGEDAEYSAKRELLRLNFEYPADKDKRDAIPLYTTPPTPPAGVPDESALYSAAINCRHEIDRDQIVLHFDHKQPGHNALNQLMLRLNAAASAMLSAAPQPATQDIPAIFKEQAS